MPNYRMPGTAEAGTISVGTPSFSRVGSQFSNGGVPHTEALKSAYEDNPRPYASVGKVGLNLLDLGQNEREAPALAETGGLFTGFFGGIGNTFGTPGREVGELLGHIIEAPLGVIGAGMAGLGGVGIGVREPGTPEGETINPAFADMSVINEQGKVTIGSVVQSGLGVFGLMGRAVERAYAGTDMRTLPADLQEKMDAGEITREQAADLLVQRGAGYTDDMVTNIGLSLLLDPLTWLTLGVGAVGKGAAATAKVISGLDKAGTVAKAGWLDDAGRLTAAGARAAMGEDSSITKLSRLEAFGLATAGRASTLTPDSAFVRVANQVTRITDPLRLFGGGSIGKRTTDHVMAASTEGALASWKPGVVASLEKAFDAAADGGGQNLDKALGVAVTNTVHRWIADEYIGDALRAAGDAPDAEVRLVAGTDGIGLTPNELVRVTLANKGVDRSVGRQIEVLVERVKPFLAHLSPEELTKQTVAKAARIAKTDEATMAKHLGKVGYDEAVVIHTAFYHDLGRELVDEIIPGIRHGHNVLPEGVIPERLTMIGERTLTVERRDGLVAAIAKARAGGPGRAAAMTDIRKRIDALEDFDFIAEKQIDVKHNEDLLNIVDAWIKKNGDTALVEIRLKDASGVVRAELPAVLREWMTDAELYGYRLALAPTGSPENLFRIARDAEGRLVNARPWLDFVSEGSEMIRPNKLQALKMQAFRDIRGESIVWRSRRTFVRNLSANHGIAPATAERIFRTIVYTSTEHGVAPRGLRPHQIMDAARNALNEEHRAGGGLGRMTERDMTRELLVAFKGDFSQVGVTQAFTGSAKIRLPGAGANYWGGLAERVYPMVKFTFSPWFMMQEYIEPYILNAMRGIKTPLRTSSPGFKRALADRAAINQFLRTDLGDEGALMGMAEYNQMLSGVSGIVHQRLGSYMSQLNADVWGNIGIRKEVAVAMLTKRVFGQRLKEAFTEIRGDNGQMWRELETHYGTTDSGEIAMQWMADNAVLRDANGERITAIADILKPANFGAETKIMPGVGPGVRWHHLATFLGRTEDDADEVLIKGLRDHHLATVRNEALPAHGISYDDFIREGTDAGVPQQFLDRAYNMATGPEVDEFWDGFRKTYTFRTVAGTAEKAKEVEQARALVQVRALTMGLTEEEYIKHHFADIPRRFKGAPDSMAAADRLFEHRDGYFGPQGLFVQKHGDSFEEAAIAVGILDTESPWVYHGTLDSLSQSIDKTGMHPGSNWATELKEAEGYAVGSDAPIYRSRVDWVRGRVAREGVIEGSNVRPRFLEKSTDGGKTWVRATTKEQVYLDLPEKPAAFRSEVGYAFLKDERGMTRAFVPKAPKARKPKKGELFGENPSFEDELTLDADSWLDEPLPRDGAPNSVERVDRFLNDWEGAPTIVIPGYDKSTRTTNRVAVYLQRDEEGKIAAYSVMPLDDETGKAQAIVSTRVRDDVQGRGIATRLYEAADLDGVDARAVTGLNGVTRDGKAFSAAYKNHPPVRPYVEPAVRQQVMPELDEASQAANLFAQMVVTEPEMLLKGLDDGTIDPRHRKAIESAIETAKAQMPRPRVEFRRLDGRIERYGLVTADDLVEQNAQWMTTEQGRAAGYWYRDMRQRFVRLFGEDHGPVLLAFAVSQASAAPTNGMKNVLHVMEQLFTDGFDARVLDAANVASSKNRIRMMAAARKVIGKENWDRLRISGRGRERALMEAAETLEEAGVKITGELNEENIVKALIGAPINSGFGPKLNDFLDSLLENGTRRWAGRQGKFGPVAVDRWTARDVGFLDDVTLDHLASTYGVPGKDDIVTVFSGEGGSGKRMWTMRKEIVGYLNKKPVMGWNYVDDTGRYVDIDGNLVSKYDAEGKVIEEGQPVRVRDFTGTPKEYGYEHGVRVINEAVEKFNTYVNPDKTVGMYGRTDWTAADVQAVGWIRMQKVMEGAEESPFMTFGFSTYEMNTDIIPQLGTDLESRAHVIERLDPAKRLLVTRDLNARMGGDMMDDFGITIISTDEAHYAEMVESSIPRNRQIEVHTRTPEGWTRGRNLRPDEMGRMQVRGAKIISEALSSTKRPIATTADEIAAPLYERVSTAWNPRTIPEGDSRVRRGLAKAGDDEWGGGTFNPVTNEWVAVSEGRFVSSIGQTIRLTAEEAKDPETFNNAIKTVLADERMGHEGVVIGVFNDKSDDLVAQFGEGGVVDIDVSLMIKGDVADAESVQAYLAREGGAYDYDTGNGVYAPLITSAGTSAPMAVLSTPITAMDAADRMAISTRREMTVPLRVAASGFKPTKHRPVVDFFFPVTADKNKAVHSLLAVVNALRDEQQELVQGLRRSFKYNIWKDEAGRYALRIIDDADPGSAYFARRATAGTGVAEAKGMIDPASLQERLMRAAKVAGIDPADLANMEATHFHAELYVAKPIRTGAPRPQISTKVRAAQAAADAGDYDLMSRLTREERIEAAAAKAAAGKVDDVERADIQDAITRYGQRGRVVTESDIRRWRDAYAEHLDALLEEHAPENLGRALRGEALLERRTGAALGFTERVDGGRRIIGAFKNADPVTGLHELTHVFATDLDESGRRIVMDARATAIDARRTDLTARIAALTAKRDARKSAPARRGYDTKIAALNNELGSIADETAWGVEHEEFFVSEFQKWLRTGTAPHPKLEQVFEHFRNWLDKVWSAVKGQRGMEGETTSPQMQALFESMFSGKPPAASTHYDIDQHVLKMAAHQQLRLSQDEAFTTQYFKRGRTWAERSINHPFMGLYPFSYMFGKVLPEMFRFLALRPFGVTAPMVGWNMLNRVSDDVSLQQQTDPAFAEFIQNNGDLWMTISSLFPALPNEIPTSAPLWMRRISEQGLENAALASRGEAVKNIDLTKGMGDQVEYIFGPAQSLRRATDALTSVGDIARTALGMEQPDPRKEAARQKAIAADLDAAQQAIVSP